MNNHPSRRTWLGGILGGLLAWGCADRAPARTEPSTGAPNRSAAKPVCSLVPRFCTTETYSSDSFVWNVSIRAV
jgi:hypothetical protein